MKTNIFWLAGALVLTGMVAHQAGTGVVETLNMLNYFQTHNRFWLLMQMIILIKM